MEGGDEGNEENKIKEKIPLFLVTEKVEEKQKDRVFSESHSDGSFPKRPEREKHPWTFPRG